MKTQKSKKIKTTRKMSSSERAAEEFLAIGRIPTVKINVKNKKK